MPYIGKIAQNDHFEGSLPNVRPDLRNQTGSKVGKPIIEKLRNDLNFGPQNFQPDLTSGLDARSPHPFFFLALFGSPPYRIA